MSTKNQYFTSLRKRVGIYCIKNKVNNKKYVGSSKDIGSRFSNHVAKLRKGNHINPHIQKSWNKYKEINFEFSVLEFLDNNISLELLQEREQHWMDALASSNRKFGYNLVVKANQSYMSDEMKSKISQTKKGIPMKEETKRKLSLIKTGTEISEETKQKISKSISGKNNGMFGRKRTEEEKLKMSQNRRGIPAWNKGKPLTDKQKQTLRNNRLAHPNSIDLKTGRFIKGISPYFPSGENSIR